MEKFSLCMLPYEKDTVQKKKKKSPHSLIVEGDESFSDLS